MGTLALPILLGIVLLERNYKVELLSDRSSGKIYTCNAIVLKNDDQTVGDIGKFHINFNDVYVTARNDFWV